MASRMPERALLGLFDPGSLDGLEDLLAAAPGLVVEAVELLHPFEQVGEAERPGIRVGILFGERDRDLQGVGPFHFPPSFTMLMVYLGISIVRSPSLTIAWQDRRDCASRPQALSSISSSFSSEGASESKPSRTTTWQVVQAQDFSQACSISTPLSSRLSQIDTPVFASMTVPSGHSSWCGRTMSCGMEPRGSPLSCRPARASPRDPCGGRQRPRSRGSPARSRTGWCDGRCRKASS